MPRDGHVPRDPPRVGGEQTSRMAVQGYMEGHGRWELISGRRRKEVRSDLGRNSVETGYIAADSCAESQSTP